jgi:hypothetical protein
MISSGLGSVTDTTLLRQVVPNSWSTPYVLLALLKAAFS